MHNLCIYIPRLSHTERIKPMKITGIIAEYNPFHLGHAYQIEKARELTQADYIIVVMSGDYVQRGTPAILDKRTRAQMALTHGADLVLELPVRYSCSGACDFAYGAVSILDQLGCVDCLCFGSELGDIRPFERIARLLYTEPLTYKQELQAAMRDGCTYPAAHQRALLTVSKELHLFDDLKEFSLEAFLSGPNNTLGLEYIRALMKLSSAIRPVTLPRTQNNYHTELTEGTFASATAIRKSLYYGTSDYKEYVPSDCIPFLKEAHSHNLFVNEDDYSTLLKYKLLLEDSKTLAGYLESTLGIANRIQSLTNKFDTYSQFADLIKTRDTTRARINRILLHIILGLTKQTVPPDFIRMLGFKKAAAPLLSTLKQTATTPVISKLTQETLPTYTTDLFASNLYTTIRSTKSHTPYREEREHKLIIT